MSLRLRKMVLPITWEDMDDDGETQFFYGVVFLEDWDKFKKGETTPVLMVDFKHGVLQDYKDGPEGSLPLCAVNRTVNFRCVPVGN